MTDKRNTYTLALLLALVMAMLACTSSQGRTARDIGSGAAGVACAVAGAAEGQPWAAIVAAVSCGLERLLERRGTQQAAPVARAPFDAALVVLEHALDAALDSGAEADALAAEAALTEAERLAVEYWGTP